ncbi:MAG: aconitate hydratase, partial [Acidobacteriota bacterium]|nr:aconitate hydratase [Acidobacteriota bacterium]
LVSPETAAAAALTGEITDPRTLDMEYPRVEEPENPVILTDHLEAPLPPEESAKVELVKGPNIASFPDFDPLPDRLEIPVLLKMGDDISTDEIMPAGTRVLPFRSNIPKISEFCFDILDPTYHDRAMEVRDAGGHAVVAGDNYGQGSSREHAALAPRFLGLRLALVKSFARIHWQNLANFGILALTFADDHDYDSIQAGDVLVLENARAAIQQGRELELRNRSRDRSYQVQHTLSQRQVDMILRGGLLKWMQERLQAG